MISLGFGRFLHHIRISAGLACDIDRPVPGRMLAGGVFGAGKEHLSATSGPLDQFSRTAFFGAFYAGWEAFSSLTFRIIGAGYKSAETASPDLHGTATGGTFIINFYFLIAF